MNLESVLLGGLIATLMLTTIMAAGQGLRLSRMSLPFMIGTMFTPDRRRAMVLGFAAHFANGWVFALFYAWVFEYLRLATWWIGALLGFGQALVVLIAAMPILPYMHPRMASPDRGPDPTHALEPPGFMALNYGRQTPIITVIAHLLYGGFLGAFYRLAAG
jgi:hypothetical protein